AIRSFRATGALPLAAFALVVCLLCSWTAFGQDGRAMDADALGFSANRLDQIAPWYQAQVDAGALPGAVVMIARNGEVAYIHAIGYQDRDHKISLKPDSIFWIASMTKPVTAVAAMMLVEEGKLDLAAPVHQYLPELKNMQVAEENA